MSVVLFGLFHGLLLLPVLLSLWGPPSYSELGEVTPNKYLLEDKSNSHQQKNYPQTPPPLKANNPSEVKMELLLV